MAADFFYAAGMGNADTETDLFMFNFLGFSGKFVYDNNKNIVLIPHQDLKIESYVEGYRDGFMVTASDGVKYIFLDSETTLSTYIGGGHPAGPGDIVTAWYLTRIIHPLGDTVEFEYVGQGYEYISSLSQTFEVMSPSPQFACGDLIAGPPVLPAPIQNKSRIVGRQLAGISSNNPVNGKVVFVSGKDCPNLASYYFVTGITVLDNNLSVIEKFNFEYITTANNRTFLREVRYKDANKNYQFGYMDPDGLTQRLSFNQDHWGYYNGNKNNNCLVPKLTDVIPFSNIDVGADREPDGTYARKGLLNKITYPTKGHTEITYGPNTHYSTVTVPGHETTLAVIANTGGDGFGSGYDKTETFYSPCNQRAQIFVGVSFNSHECSSDLDMGKSKATLNIYNKQTNQPVVLYIKTASGNFIPRDGNVFTPDGNGECYVNLGVGSYSVTLHPTFECVESSAGVHYLDVPPHNEMANVEVGGSRVQKIISHDPVQSLNDTTRYYYGPMDMPDSISSGDAGQKAYYVLDRVHLVDCGTEWRDSVYYVLLSSNSLNPLFNTGNNNIYYKYVTISHGGDDFENGGEQHEFTVHRDSPGNLVLGKDSIKSAPWSNFGWDNGLEKSITFFKKAGPAKYTILKKVINNYITDTRNYTEVNGYSVRKNYENILSADVTYECKESDLTKKYYYTYCAANHKHHWVLWLDSYRCNASGHDMQTREICHPCYGKTLPYTHIYTWMLDNLDIMEYKNISYWHYLDNTKIVDYDGDGLNPVTTNTNYFYDNKKHLQLTRSETTNSNGDVLVSKTYYPDDLGLTGLVAQHRTAEPVKTEKYANNTKTFTRQVTYKDWGGGMLLPEQVTSSTGSNALETDMRYYKYDSKGNPLELSKENDMHTAYVWGYGGTFPVIKADNATYSNLAAAAGQATNNLESLLAGIGDMSTDTLISTWKTFNTNLRANSLLKNAMVNTYTYKPLVGATSRTGPDNITTFYEYDDFGRLDVIRNSDNQIIKGIDYNYAQKYEITLVPSPGGRISLGDGTIIKSETCLMITVGEDLTVNLDPLANYYVKNVKVDGSPLGKIKQYIFTDITGDHVLEVEFAIKQQYTLTVSYAGTGNGTTGMANGTAIYSGDKLSITANPEISSVFAGWGGDYPGNQNPLAIAEVTGNISITATFTLKKYNIVGYVIITRIYL